MMKYFLFCIILAFSFTAVNAQKVKVRFYIYDDYTKGLITNEEVILNILGDTHGMGKEHKINAVDQNGIIELEWEKGTELQYNITSDNWLLGSDQTYTPPKNSTDYSCKIFLQSNVLKFKGRVSRGANLLKDITANLSFIKNDDSVYVGTTNSSGDYCIKVPNANEHYGHRYVISFLQNSTLLVPAKKDVTIVGQNDYKIDAIVPTAAVTTPSVTPVPVYVHPNFTAGIFFNYCKFFEKSGTKIKTPFFIDAGFEKYFSLRKTTLLSWGGSLNIVPALFNEINSFTTPTGILAKTNDQITINNVAELYFFYHTPYISITQPTFCFGVGVAFNYGNLSNINLAVGNNDFAPIPTPTQPSTLTLMPKAYAGINFPLSNKFSLEGLFFGSVFGSDAVSLSSNPGGVAPTVNYVHRTHVIIGLDIKVLCNFYKRQ